MAPMTSMPGEMQGTVVSSMGPQGQPGMMPMRPGMSMGMVGQPTIISSQMNGPNGQMVRTVGQNMGGMGGPMQLRQGVPGMIGPNRMISPGVRMPGQVRVSVLIIVLGHGFCRSLPHPSSILPFSHSLPRSPPV